MNNATRSFIILILVILLLGSLAACKTVELNVVTYPSENTPPPDNTHQFENTPPPETPHVESAVPPEKPTPETVINLPEPGDWEAAYIEFLRGVETYGYVERDYFVPGSFGVTPAFYMYDIDNDGIPELILITDDGDWEFSSCDIFTYAGNVVSMLGSIEWDWFGSIGAPDNLNEGLLSVAGYKSLGGSLYYYTIRDGVLVEQIVYEWVLRPFPDEDAYVKTYDMNSDTWSVIEGDPQYVEDCMRAQNQYDFTFLFFYQINEESIMEAISNY